MKKVLLTLSLVAFLATSCGTKKKLAELESKNKEIQDLLNTATVKLNTCLTEKEGMDNNKPADFRYTYNYSNIEFSIKKEV